MSRAYVPAMVKTLKAYGAYREALEAFRARKIGDAEMIAARKAYKATRRVSDRAYAAMEAG